MHTPEKHRHAPRRPSPPYRLTQAAGAPLLALLLALGATPALALDPFGTDALAPPRPVLGAETGSASPCSDAPQVFSQPLSLLDVVDRALCHNPQTREVWANARAQAALVGVAQSAYLPSLNLSASQSRNRNDARTPERYTQKNASLTLSYLLFDFGARAATLENARQLLAAAAATQDSTVQSVFLAALQAYYQTQAGEAALAAARESEKAAQESFNAADARYKVGSATPADRLQAQTAYSQASLVRIQAERDLKNAQGTLANVIGSDAYRPPVLVPAAPVGTPDKGLVKDVEALVGEARKRRPDLLAAEAQYQAAQANVDAVRAAGLPTLSLSAGPAYQDLGGIASNTSAIGVTVSIPLFSGFSTTYKVRNAEALKEAREAQRERIRLQVALDVWKSYQGLISSAQALQTTADLLNSAEAAQKVALGRYKAGVGSILDVLNAQSALASARQQRVQATFDWNVSRASLAQSMGNLDISLLQQLPDAGTPGATPAAPAAPLSATPASQTPRGPSQPALSGTSQGQN